jgi:hypothetical protein
LYKAVLGWKPETRNPKSESNGNDRMPEAVFAVSGLWIHSGFWFRASGFIGISV